MSLLSQRRLTEIAGYRWCGVLLVRLEKKEHADLLLKMRFNLREAGFVNIYINKDLPREEREKERLPRQELKEKGKDTHVIFRGRVVPRHEQQE